MTLGRSEMSLKHARLPMISMFLKRLPSPSSALALAFAFALAPAFALTPVLPVQAQSTDKFAKLDQLIDLIEQHDRALGSIHISHEGKPVYSRAFGMRGISDGDTLMADTETIYRVGSVTKTFTAVMALQLAEEGKLRLDSKLSEYYPSIPNAEKITIEHLLQHRSGLFNFTNREDFLSYMVQGKSKDQLVELFSALNTNFEPGEKYEYSNTGYVLLGFIIEDVSGKPYDQLLAERISNKIGLKNTHYGKSIDVTANEAQSFARLENWMLVPESNLNVPGAAGAVASTPSDITRFFEALFNGELINAASLKAMTTLVDNYGYGVFSLPFYDKRAIGHNGNIDAFYASAAYFQDAKLAVSYISNGNAYPGNDIVIAMLSSWFGRDFELPNFDGAQVSSELLQSYVGNYKNPSFPIVISILFENGRLFGQATGQPRFPLTAAEDGSFKFDQAQISIRFDTDESKMYFKQAGQEIVFTKE